MSCTPAPSTAHLLPLPSSCHALALAWTFSYLLFFRALSLLGLPTPTPFTNAVQLLLTLKVRLPSSPRGVPVNHPNFTFSSQPLRGRQRKGDGLSHTPRRGRGFTSQLFPEVKKYPKLHNCGCHVVSELKCIFVASHFAKDNQLWGGST